MTEHPVTPPPGLVQQWRQKLPTGMFDGYSYTQREVDLCMTAAQWGADQELEACCKWLDENLPGYDACEGSLHAARRPKPPSLKEQALRALEHAPGPDQPNPITLLTADEHALIRRALEQLDD
jgi:hypothetical protein